MYVYVYMVGIKLTSLYTSTNVSAKHPEKFGISHVGLLKSRSSHMRCDCPSYRFGHSAKIGRPGELAGQFTPNNVSFAHNSTVPRSTTYT